jgi:threonine dehydrogenase-like Zn-dependent dehydrogenase
MSKVISQGSEHTYFSGWDPAKNPVILGDEGSITIVKVGRNLEKKFKIGQRYTIKTPLRCNPINNTSNYREKLWFILICGWKNRLSLAVSGMPKKRYRFLRNILKF